MMLNQNEPELGRLKRVSNTRQFIVRWVMSKTDAGEPKQERHYFGIPITKILAGVWAILGPFVGGGITYWWTNHAADIRYSVSDPVDFHGEKNNFGVVLFTVSNRGNKEAKDVTIFSSLRGVDIQEVTLNQPQLNAVNETKGDELSVRIPMLNPSEMLQISVLVRNPPKAIASTSVHVRGEGVTGVVGATPTSYEPWVLVVAVTVNTVILCIALFLIFARLLARMRRDTMKMVEARGKMFERYIIHQQGRDRPDPNAQWPSVDYS
jgi:hypothetical protein